MASTNTTGKKFAQIVNPQVNPNSPKQENWTNITNAVGNTNLLATSHYTKKTSTTGKGKKKKTITTYTNPYTVTAHDFKLDIPRNARIDEIKVVVRMKSNKSSSESVDPPTFPMVGFYIRDGGKTVRNSSDTKSSGWKNNVYWVASNKKLTNSLASTTYTMSGDNFRKGGYTVDDLNSTYCGVDLKFRGEHSNTTISLMYVYMEVLYTIPTYSIATNYTSDKDNPHIAQSGQTTYLQYTVTQSSDLRDVEQRMELTLPWGNTYDGAVTSTESNANVNSFVVDTADSQKKIWILKFNGVGKATMTVPFIDYTVDEQEITLKNITSPKPLQPIPDKSFYYRTDRAWTDGFEDISIRYTAPVRKRHHTCFVIDAVAQSNDNEVVYQIFNSEDWHFDEAELDVESSSTGVKLLSDVEERDVSKNGWIALRFSIPNEYVNKKAHVSFRVCMKPFVEGSNQLRVHAGDSDKNYYCPYTVLEPYVYHIGSTDNENEKSEPPQWHEVLTGERINFTNHRIATNLETGAFVLPCHVKDGDSLMIQEKPTLHMYKWEELDYIGCVPLEHLHFDPKSTYKDKLLDSRYKNKRYMGKELASDEDISLNVRLHPHQVTTIQGLIDMDKPIPINANHRCFEGDSLNHRGWAEIYGITTTLTNPHWYKCDIDVKYLTHNLNTRFHIEKGDKTFATFPIPPMYYETNSSGSSISNNEDEDYFVVDTDGTYAYVEDTSNWVDYLDYQGEPVKWIGGYWDDNEPSQYHGTVLTVEEYDDNIEDGGELVEYKAVKSPTDDSNEILEYLIQSGETVKDFEINKYIQVREDYLMDDVLKNRFTLDEGQHISIKSKEPISSQNQIAIKWASSKLAEDIENAISRITRLIDEDSGDVVFEYEYCDFDFSNFIAYKDIAESYAVESVLSCRVIGRRKNNADYEVVIDDIIDLQSDVETREYQYTDEDNEVHTELKYYGSNLIFELDNSKLTVIDEGYNGKEIERTFELEGKQYRWETYWENKNTGGENDDIIAYFDIVVQDSALDSTFADKYSSMYISPFPVNNKEILFTRKAEEGIIYYLKDNDEEFTYLIEPYYQYHNGVDLRNSSHASIFNLNYGYKTVYLENGLVSLGINRLNGKLFLSKYNPISQEYESLFHLHLNKFDDVNINSISDDRIELQASDTTFIMYRGHPYVIIKHELESIGIDSKFYQVYGQSVDGEQHDYPLYFDLMNKENLLTDCVTKKLDDDCVNLVEEEVEDLDSVTLKLNRIGDETVYENSTIDFNVKDNNDQPFMDRVCYLVKYDTEDGFDEVECNSDGTFSYPNTEDGSLKQGAYSFIAVYVGDDTHTYAISNEVAVQVGETPVQPHDEPIPPTPPLTGDYKLTMSCPSTMHYLDGSKVTFTLTKGGVPVQGETVEMVDFSYINTGLTDSKGQVSFVNTHPTSHPKKWKLGARFWYEGSKKMIKQFKTVEVKKATPEFHVNYYAKKEGGKVSFNLRDKNHTSNKLGKRKVTIKVNNTKYNRVTNEKGSEAIKIEKRGNTKYVCIFGGDKDYNKCTYTFREYVGKK